MTLFGLDGAREEAAKLSEKAVSLLESLEQKNEFLNLLVAKLVNRRK